MVLISGKDELISGNPLKKKKCFVNQKIQNIFPNNNKRSNHKQ